MLRFGHGKESTAAEAALVRLRDDDLSELYEVRITGEPHASALALDHISPEGVESLGSDLQAMGTAEDSSPWLETHDRFHASLYQLSGRSRMVALLDRARVQTRRYAWIPLDRNAAEIAAEHELILSAVKRRDPRSLRVMVEAHLTRSYQTVSRQLTGLLQRIDLGGDAQRATA